MFAVMFGYSLVQMARRQDAAGASPAAVRSMLLRRNVALLAIGLVHGLLLFSGDFLGAYGLVGVIFTLLLLRRGDRVHRIVLWLWGLMAVETLVLAVVATAQVIGSSGPAAKVSTSPYDAHLAPDYLTSLVARLQDWPVHTLTVVPFIVIVWLGAWAARKGVLEEPAAHRRLLGWTAGIGLTLAFAGGLPIGLVNADVLHVDSAAVSALFMLSRATGMFGGPGYVALFGLLAIAVPTRSRRHPAVAALTALGQRSLSGYLFQSVAWLLLASHFAVAIGERTASPTFASADSATAVWLATLLGAYLMQRHSYRGPAETLLRRLTYGRRSAPSPAPPNNAQKCAE